MTRAIRTQEESEEARVKREREFTIWFVQMAMVLLLSLAIGMWFFDQSPERPTLDTEIQTEGQ